MKAFVILCLLVVAAYGASLTKEEKQYMLKNNRLPKKSRIQVPAAETNVIVPQEKIDVCASCQTLVKDLKNAMENPIELEVITEGLKLLCEFMGSYSDDCKNMIDNLPNIIHELEPLMDNPLLVCQQLHFCNQGQITFRDRIVYLGMKTALRYMKKQGMGDIACEECQLAVAELKSVLQDPNIQDELKNAIKQLCSVYQPIESECDDFVENYFPVLVQELNVFLNDPKGVCTDVGLCSAAAGSEIVIRGHPLRAAIRAYRRGLVPLTHSRRMSKTEEFMQMFTRVQTRAGLNAGCTICEVSIQTLVNIFQMDPQALAGVADGLRQLCTKLPAEIAPQCNDFLSVYLQSVLVVCLNEIDARQICNMLHACTNQAQRDLDVLTSEQKSAAMCEACELLTQFVKSEVQQPSFQQEILETVKQACLKLPGSFDDKCTDLADQYVPWALQQLAS